METEVWLDETETTPGLVVAKSHNYDTHSALVDRAALAVFDAIRSTTRPGGKEAAVLSAYRSVERVMFPVSKIPSDDPFEYGYMHLPFGHGPVRVVYEPNCIQVSVDRVCSLTTSPWSFCTDAQELMNKPSFGSDVEELKDFVRSVGLEEVRFHALARAHEAHEFVREVLRYGGREERETIARWGLKAPESNPRSWVYFIRRGETGPIKIGWSRSPVSRMAQLQTGQEVQLHLLAMAPGGSAEEGALHRRFGAFRLTGEWFSASPVLEAYVRAVRSAGVL